MHNFLSQQQKSTVRSIQSNFKHKQQNKLDHIKLSKQLKKPNITQIKNQIESILKRNNSPTSFLQYSSKTDLHDNSDSTTNKIINFKIKRNKQQRNLPQQENIKKTLNHRKNYQEFLLADLISNKNKNIRRKSENHNFSSLQIYETSKNKQIYNTINHQTPTFYPKQQFQTTYTPKTNIYGPIKGARINQINNQKSIFTEKQYKQLGLGKILFIQNNNIKLRRKDLLEGTSTQRRNLFKNNGILVQDSSVTHNMDNKEINFDFSKFLKSSSSAMIQDPLLNKNQSTEFNTLQPKASLQIFKKELIHKSSQKYDSDSSFMTINPQNSNSLHKTKFMLKTNRSSSQKLKDKIRQYQLSPHMRQNNNPSQIANYDKSLNVLDQELLTYYDKLKNRNFANNAIVIMKRNIDQKYQEKQHINRRTLHNTKNVMLKNNQKVFNMGQIKNDIITSNSIQFRTSVDFKRFSYRKAENYNIGVRQNIYQSYNLKQSEQSDYPIMQVQNSKKNKNNQLQNSINPWDKSKPQDDFHYHQQYQLRQQTHQQA